MKKARVAHSKKELVLIEALMRLAFQKEKVDGSEHWDHNAYTASAKIAQEALINAKVIKASAFEAEVEIADMTIMLPGSIHQETSSILL